MRTSLVTFGICAALGCLVPVACTLYPGVDDDCSGTGTCALDDAASDADAAPLPDAPIDGGNEGDVDGAVDAPIDSADTAPGCDPAGDPKSAPCIVTEANGLFVAPSGNDTTGDGSKAKPFATIGVAAPKAKAANKPRVFACAGAYPDALTLDKTSDGVRIFGGLDCTAWTYGAANKVALAPASGPALTITGTTTGITITDVSFTSASSTTDSSIGAIVSDATHVTFRRVAITAGSAGNGAPGTTPTTALGTPLKGNNADESGANGGSTAAPCTCPSGISSTGGQGGSGGVATDGANGTPIGVTNKGSTGGSSCSPGTRGADGALATNGSGAASLGAVAGTTWTPASGTKGPFGATGQGGGGGGGVNGDANGGGGGGCGGCGGEGGGAGTGGFASIALLALASDITIEASTLTSSKAGDGGAGAVGEVGVIGATRGIPSSHGNGCQGGVGGNGANGGTGGGGAGGISAPIAWKGTQPSLVGSTNTLTPGTAGAKGVGGAPGANDGVVGMSGATIALP